MSQQVPQWDFFETSFEGPTLRNPFVDATVDAVFAYGNREVKMPAFHDGGNTWRVRFMPDTQGSWTFRTVSNVKQLDGQAGSLVGRFMPAQNMMVSAATAMAIRKLSLCMASGGLAA